MFFNALIFIFAVLLEKFDGTHEEMVLVRRGSRLMNCKISLAAILLIL